MNLRHRQLLRCGAALVGIVCGLARPTAARPSSDPGSGVPDSILRFETLRLSDAATASVPGAAAIQRRTGGARLAVSFHTLGRTFDLDLERNDDLFAPGARTVWVGDAGLIEEPPGRQFYRGRVRGSDDSWVRMAVHDGILDGIVWTPEEAYFVEPADRFFADAEPGEMITYRLSDTVSDWNDESCASEGLRSLHRTGPRGDAGHGASPKTRRTLLDPSTAALQQALPAQGMRVLDLGAVADNLYYQRHGAASATFLQNVINLIDGVYQREINLRVRIANTVIYTGSDPFTTSTDPNTILNDFSAFSGNNHGVNGLLYGADLAHLFTGRDLGGPSSSVVGIAWLSATCDPSWGSGVSQDYTSTINSLVSLTAHEMGHNLGSQHDTNLGCPSGFIMYPSVVTVADLQNLHFSSCSQSVIASHIASRSCLALDTPSTPSPTMTPIPTASATATGTATRTTTPTLTPPPEREPRARELITSYYNDVLGRAPEAGAVDSWYNGYFLASVNTGVDVRFVPQEMGRLFFLSAEYASRNRSNAEFIRDCYQAFLRRQPSQAELDTWLADPSWNRPQVVTMFAQSAEFSTYVGGQFPGLSGEAARNLVTALYIGLLDRLVDPAGLDYFAGRFNAAYASAGIEGVRSEARSLGQMTLASAEYQSKNPTNATHVERLYRGYLGRFPATSELNYWRGELDAGRQTTTSLINAFAASAEFSAMLQAYFGSA